MIRANTIVNLIVILVIVVVSVIGIKRSQDVEPVDRYEFQQFVDHNQPTTNSPVYSFLYTRIADRQRVDGPVVIYAEWIEITELKPIYLIQLKVMEKLRAAMWLAERTNAGR